MRKLISLCVMVIFCLSAVPLMATAVYVENFSFEEPGSGKIAGWDRVPGWESDTAASDSGVESDWPGSTDGVWAAFIYNNDPSVWQLTEFPIPEGVSFTLKVDAQDNWSEIPPGVLKMSLFYDDAGTRVEVASQTVETGWPWAEFTLPFNVIDVPESVNHYIGIEFQNVTEEGASWIGLDNVRLNVDFCGIVYPPDGATNIPVDADLEWTLKPGFNCDVYFSTDPNVPVEDQVIFNEAVTTYDPGTLEFETTYYWKVDPIDPNDGQPIVYPGEIWSFSTMGALPYISTQPQNITIASSETAVFMIEVVSPFPVTYKWYKVGDDTTIWSTTDTLSIPNIQTGDEGYFYCVVENQEGPVTSDQARLLTQRLMGWWKLEGNATDSVALEIPGVPTHDGTLPVDPNFIVDGIDGQGYEFFGDGRIILFQDTGEYYNFHPQGMTVSVWFKSTNANWDGVVTKHLRDDETGWVGWLIDVNRQGDWGPVGAHFTVRGSHGDLFGNADDGDLFEGEWHLVTAVMDPETQTSRVYIDGVQKNESSPYDFSAIAMNNEPIVFGAEDQYGRIPYTGMIDDVRIWSYPLGTIDIAKLYTDFNPGVNICVNRDDPWLTMDVAGEPGEPSYCRIDIEDFAELALVWMSCNLVPECLN